MELESNKMAKSIKLVEVASLLSYEKNARLHSDEQVNQVAASIAEFGFTNPILIDDKKGIIAGHCRLAAARQLGMVSVPVIELTHMTSIQKRAYIIADNKLALNANWDDAVLKDELERLQLDNFDLELIGFNDEELGELLPKRQKTKGNTKIHEGAKEYSESDFSDFNHQCPKCGFEFNK